MLGNIVEDSLLKDVPLVRQQFPVEHFLQRDHRPAQKHSVVKNTQGLRFFVCHLKRVSLQVFRQVDPLQGIRDQDIIQEFAYSQDVLDFRVGVGRVGRFYFHGSYYKSKIPNKMREDQSNQSFAPITPDVLMFPGFVGPIGELVLDTSRVEKLSFQGGVVVIRLVIVVEILAVGPDGLIKVGDPHLGVLRL